jgi:hypothetical protein
VADLHNAAQAGERGSSKATAPRPDVVARITGDGVVALSSPLTARLMVIRVENETDTDYEFKFQRVPAGLTSTQFLVQPATDGPGVPWGGLSSVPPRAVVTTTIEFEPGEYIMGTRPPIRHPTSQAITVAARRQ